MSRHRVASYPRHVDLAIEPGETFGLLGPNGAGKTTTIRMLITLLKPVTGRIAVFGTHTRPACGWTWAC